MKWVVVFAGSRDKYQVPLALAEDNRLERLVTDFYSPLDTPLGRILRYAAPGAHLALSHRYNRGVSSAKVSWSATGLSSDYLLHRTQVARDDRLAMMAGRVARARDCGLLSYSYYGHTAFHSVGLKYWPKVLMQVHPHPVSVRKILREELSYSEFGRDSLLSEQEISSDQGRFEQLAAEALIADHCIVASNFTKRTLIENGVREQRIHLVHYGVDIGDRKVQHRRSDQFRVLFVGQMVQRKGLEYLLKAWKRLRLPKAELVLAGRGRVDTKLLAAFRSDVTYMNDLSDGKLEELYDSSDLFCMPSLVEGFGLVYLEALARGVPVIATPNTGAADIVEDGREGFIVPIRDIDALAEKLEWAYANRSALAEMGTAARKLAEQHSWARFRTGIRESLYRIEGEGKDSHDMATNQATSIAS